MKSQKDELVLGGFCGVFIPGWSSSVLFCFEQIQSLGTGMWKRVDHTNTSKLKLNCPHVNHTSSLSPKFISDL